MDHSGGYERKEEETAGQYEKRCVGKQKNRK